MLRVGLTGGLATGKTYVGKLLESHGCALLQADLVGRLVLAKEGGEAYQQVVSTFGPGILAPSGDIDRRLLAAQVFSQPERLAQLNSIVHPAVFQREELWLRQCEQASARAIAVVEAAILIETGSYKRFQRIILTTCPEPLQIERARQRDGLTEQEARARIARQLPLSEKLAHAHYVLDTSGSPEETALRAAAIFESLRRLAG